MPLSNSDEDNCLERAALLDQQKGDWAQREYAVSAGSDNAFLLRGRTATLASTPDLIVARDDHVLIIGVHTGQQHRSHGTLVRIYMYALRKALGRYHGMVLPGKVVYPDRTEQVLQGSVDQGLIRDLGALIRRITADKPATRVPSEQECRFCDITAADCPERLTGLFNATERLTGHHEPEPIADTPSARAIMTTATTHCRSSL